METVSLEQRLLKRKFKVLELEDKIIDIRLIEQWDSNIKLKIPHLEVLGIN